MNAQPNADQTALVAAIADALGVDADQFAAPALSAINGVPVVEIVELPRLMTGPELANPRELPPYLVDDLLEENSECSLIGPKGSYKSLFAIELGVCVAMGELFFGHETTPGLVVYCCGEGLGGVRQRLEALSIDREFQVPETFVIHDGGQGGSIPETVTRAEQRCDQKLKLLIIDTYSRFVPAGMDPDKDRDLYSFLRECRAVRGDAALILVHHTGHSDATRARGTSAWGQAMDTEFIVSAKGSDDTRTFENTKQKDGPLATAMTFTLKEVKLKSTRRDRNGGPPKLVTSVVLEPTVLEVRQKRPAGKWASALWDAVEEEPGIHEDKLIKIVVEQYPGGNDAKGNNRTSARRALDKLIQTTSFKRTAAGGIFRADDPTADFEATQERTP